MLRYAITNGRVGVEAAEGSPELLASRCGVLARENVDFILIREKALAAGRLAALGREIVAAVRRSGGETRVLVAGRADVALAAHADGVHLGSAPGELRVSEARQVYPAAFVSVSCHTLDEVKRARDDGASAVLFAPVFGKWVAGVEVVAAVGLRALQQACAAAGAMPVFALGGVTEANAAECLRMGAAGVAGIRMFFAGEDRE